MWPQKVILNGHDWFYTAYQTDGGKVLNYVMCGYGLLLCAQNASSESGFLVPTPLATISKMVCDFDTPLLDLHTHYATFRHIKLRETQDQEEYEFTQGQQDRGSSSLFSVHHRSKNRSNLNLLEYKVTDLVNWS